MAGRLKARSISQPPTPSVKRILDCRVGRSTRRKDLCKKVSSSVRLRGATNRCVSQVCDRKRSPRGDTEQSLRRQRDHRGTCLPPILSRHAKRVQEFYQNAQRTVREPIHLPVPSALPPMTDCLTGAASQVARSHNRRTPLSAVPGTRERRLHAAGTTEEGSAVHDPPSGRPLCGDVTPFRSDVTRSSFLQILEALEDVHDLGATHGSLEPANIMWFSADCTWKLIDLKCASTAGDWTLVDAAVGKYSAPEIRYAERLGRQRVHLDPPADMWSFGVIALETLTGAPLSFSLIPRSRLPTVLSREDVRGFQQRPEVHRRRRLGLQSGRRSRRQVAVRRSMRSTWGQR